MTKSEFISYNKPWYTGTVYTIYTYSSAITNVKLHKLNDNPATLATTFTRMLEYYMNNISLLTPGTRNYIASILFFENNEAYCCPEEPLLPTGWRIQVLLESKWLFPDPDQKNSLITDPESHEAFGNVLLYIRIHGKL